MTWGKPVPTPRLVTLLGLGLFPLALSAGLPELRAWAFLWDGLLFLAMGFDYALAPPSSELRVERRVAEVLSAGIPQPVELHLEWWGPRSLSGEVRDVAPLGVQVDHPRQAFRIHSTPASTQVRYTILSEARGDLHFGDAYVRLLGPLKLCARQTRVPLSQTVKVFPNLSALAGDALALARASEDWAKRPLRRMGAGSEFESLRLYAPGDDVRHMDWKATARRGAPIVRVHQPEKNQTVLLLLDCGRHMAGLLKGRRKLDHAVDACLRLARVSLEAGDAVGLLAFGTQRLAQLAPKKGKAQLKAITHALYRVEAQLAESDYGRALETAFARRSRRTLVVVFTDLLDRETSAALVKRTLALLPRHLPVVVSLVDEELEAAAHDPPATPQAAYARHVAAGLDEEYRLNATRLRDQGARVVRAPPSALGAAAVSEYLVVKGKGLL